MIFSRNGEAWVLSKLKSLLQISTMSLASTGVDGEPHSASVFFAADENLNLHFFSDPGSQHALDLVRDPRAAVVFYPENQRWQEIHGLQMRGVVFPTLPGPDWESAWQIYSDKFPFVVDLKDVVARNQFYIFVPVWIRLLDNRQGFGYKEEWARPQGNGPEARTAPWRRIGPGDPRTGDGGTGDA
jgi:uncharacterized protein YhbP (UPF0306 family)